MSVMFSNVKFKWWKYCQSILDIESLDYNYLPPFLYFAFLICIAELVLEAVILLTVVVHQGSQIANQGRYSIWFSWLFYLLMYINFMIYSNTSINHYSSGIIDDFRILKPCDDLQDFEGDLVAMSDFDLIEFQLNTWENDEYANAKTFCLTQFVFEFFLWNHFILINILRWWVKHFSLNL